MTADSLNPYQPPVVVSRSLDDLRYRDQDCLIVYDGAKLPPFCPFSGKAAPKRGRFSRIYLRRVSGRKARWFDEVLRLTLIVAFALNPLEKYFSSAWILLAVVSLILGWTIVRSLRGAHIRCYLSPAFRCRRILAMAGRVLLPFTIFFLLPGEVSPRLMPYAEGISWTACSIMSILAVFVFTERQWVTVASKGNWFRLAGCDRDFLSKLPQVTNPPI